MNRTIYKENSIRFQVISQEMLCLLAKQSMSKHELIEAMGLSLSTVVSYIKVLREKNLVHISDWIAKPNTKPTAKYSFGVGEDKVYLARRKYPSKGRPRKPVVNLTTCDIAASWMNNPL